MTTAYRENAFKALPGEELCEIDLQKVDVKLQALLADGDIREYVLMFEGGAPEPKVSDDGVFFWGGTKNHPRERCAYAKPEFEAWLERSAKTGVASWPLSDGSIVAVPWHRVVKVVGTLTKKIVKLRCAELPSSDYENQ